MSALRLIALFFLLISPATTLADNLERIKDAVVKIHITSASPDYFNPWNLMNPSQNSGSGAVIKGNRILTNAHVVADARYIQAQRNGEPLKYLATVEFISHEADLAILRVQNPDFFKGIKPLKIGKLANPLEEVSVFGYPIGGNALSITKGILSRVEHQKYAHAGSFLLAGQIDAAINPGNSGGPVIANNKIVGVVMQANSGRRAENLGYFVPPSVIKHVLKDAQDTIHDGFPKLGFQTQGLESPAMKKAFGLKKHQSGVLVAKVAKGSPADGILKPNDVILQIDGFNLADDETITFHKHQRTNYKYAIDQYHINDDIAFTFIRDGKQQTVNIKATKANRRYDLVIPEQFDSSPQYYIYGGVVFVPLNMNLIKRWGRDWHRQAPVSFLASREEWSTPEKHEQIVALKVLAADVNLGYHDWKNWLIHAVNGEPIRDFKHFTHMLDNNRENVTVFSDKSGFKMMIDHQQAVQSEADILNLYRIRQRSYLLPSMVKDQEER